MAISYKIYDFPSLPVRAQMFYAGGQAFEAGFTSGGVRVSSPEPGGRAFLETELSLQTKEFQSPLFSWLMSKGNGDVFKIRLTATPQLVSQVSLVGKVTKVPWNNGKNWNNDQPWFYNPYINIVTPALEGSTTIVVDMSSYGQIILVGHVIGVDNSAYMVDEIEYDTLNFATITVSPPIRKDTDDLSQLYFRPYFTGSIVNIAEMRTTYEAINLGSIKPQRIIFSEVIL